MPILAFASLLADADAGEVIIACLVLIPVVIVGSVAAMWLRRWARRPDEIPAGGFTLGALRDLHRSGKLSTEEFERTKAMIIDAAKKASQKKDSPLPPNINIR